MKITTKTILTAIDPCDMSNGEGPALIVGKEYKVKTVTHERIYIASEIDTWHSFLINELDEFFKIKSMAAKLFC